MCIRDRQKRMDEVLDGEYQMYSVISGKEQLDHWTKGNPELKEIMSGLTDEEVKKIKRGGFDRKKLYAAFERAVNTKGKPTVILIKTLKGYGLGERAEGTNTTHQKKQMSDDCLLYTSPSPRDRQKSRMPSSA